MTTAEWIAVASIVTGVIMTLLSGITSLFCGALLWYMRRDSSRSDEDRKATGKSIASLATAATDLTIELRQLQIELKSLREYVHGEVDELTTSHKEMRAEINLLKDRTRDTWRGDT